MQDEVDEAIEYIQEEFPHIYRQNQSLQAYLDVMKFLNLIKKKENTQAADFMDKNLSQFSRYQTQKGAGCR